MKSERKTVRVKTKQVLYWSLLENRLPWAHASSAPVPVAVAHKPRGWTPIPSCPSETHHLTCSSGGAGAASQQEDNVCHSCLACSQALTGTRHRKGVCVCVSMLLLGIWKWKSGEAAGIGGKNGNALGLDIRSAVYEHTHIHKNTHTLNAVQQVC